jgi:hypothetical protein
MAEVLGIIGSAITLAGVVLELTAFIKNLSAKVSDAPKTIQRQLVQVEQLVDIANLIERNPQLQTPLVSSILANCVHDAEALRALLTKLISPSTLRGYWKALPGITIKENRILALLKRLEEGKASLALCIASIDSYGQDTLNAKYITLTRTQENPKFYKLRDRIHQPRSRIHRERATRNQGYPQWRYYYPERATWNLR